MPRRAAKELTCSSPSRCAAGVPGRVELARGTGRLRHVRAGRWWAALTVGLIGLMGGSAAAHLRVTSPQARHDSLKQGPCGAGADDPRGSVVHTFKPGQTITVEWDEYVDHPGHFRISFDAEGQDDFVDPVGFTDVSGGPSVLLDGIPDHAGGGMYSQSLTLPDVECDQCTLQVIQVMSDKPPYGDGNDLYYQCIDLVLSRAASGESTSAEVVDEAGCGCQGSAAPSGAALGLLLLGLRRRRAGV